MIIALSHHKEQFWSFELFADNFKLKFYATENLDQPFVFQDPNKLWIYYAHLKSSALAPSGSSVSGVDSPSDTQWMRFHTVCLLGRHL